MAEAKEERLEVDLGERGGAHVFSKFEDLRAWINNRGMVAAILKTAERREPA